VPWQRQYRQAWNRLAREELQQGVDPEHSQLKRIDERQQQIEQGLGIEGVVADEETVNPPSAGDMFDALAAGTPTIARFTSTAGGGLPRIRFPGVQGSSPWAIAGRWLLVLVVLAGIMLVRRNSTLHEFLGRWPFAWGALGGLAWWLWLSPSMVGILVMLLAAGGALRSARASWLKAAPVRRRPSAGSTVTFVKR
jgi:hypothetical protein